MVGSAKHAPPQAARTDPIRSRAIGPDSLPADAEPFGGQLGALHPRSDLLECDVASEPNRSPHQSTGLSLALVQAAKARSRGYRNKQDDHHHLPHRRQTPPTRPHQPQARLHALTLSNPLETAMNLDVALYRRNSPVRSDVRSLRPPSQICSHVSASPYGGSTS